MSSKREVKKVLIVNPNAEQSGRLAHQLQFIDFDTKVFSSSELVEALPEVGEFQAVLVANFHGIVDWVTRLKAKHCWAISQPTLARKRLKIISSGA